LTLVLPVLMLALSAHSADDGDAYWSKSNQAEVAKAQARADADAAEAGRQDRVRRQVCGADYANPQVGMTVARVRSCVGDLVLQGQMNRKDGVASVYRSGRLQLVVMEGKVVAWERR